MGRFFKYEANGFICDFHESGDAADKPAFFKYEPNEGFLCIVNELP